MTTPLRGIAVGIAIAIACWMLVRSPGSPTRDAVAAGGTTFATEKVFVVFIDGIRLQDSYKAADFRATEFGLASPADQTTRFTNILRPIGTLYTNARTGVTNTVTTPCTNNIVTGAWHEGPNRGRGIEIDDDEYIDNRTLVRTIFERARGELGLPQSKVAFVTDKLNTRLSDHSYHPGGGISQAPTYLPFSPRFNDLEPEGEETFVDLDSNSMRDVLQTTFDLMDTSSPDLLFVGLGLVDIAGHRAVSNDRDDFGFYLDSIRAFDELLIELWDGIQAHPDYGGKSTVILVSDHGRHEDHTPTSFGSHTGTCDGIRDLMLFVVGPDTPAGLEVDRRAFQVDIAPTVARLMGFDVPESTGRPLYEAIGVTPGAEHPLYLTGTHADIDDLGTIHAVSRRSTGGGDFEIVVQSAAWDGDFGTPQVLASEPWTSERFLDYPEIVTVGSQVDVAAWRWNEDARDLRRNHEILTWSSNDRGVTFPSVPQLLLTGRTEDSSIGFTSISDFDLSWVGGKKTFLIPTVQYPGYRNLATVARIAAPVLSRFMPRTIEDEISDVRRFGHQRDAELVEASDGTLYGTWSSMLLPTDTGTDPIRATWDILVKDLTNTEATDEPWRLTDNDLDTDVQPALAMDTEGATDQLHVVFSKWDATDGFQVWTTASTDLSTGTFRPLSRLTDAPSQSWEPDALFADGLLHVVYTSYAPGEDGEVFYVPVLNGTAVGVPTNLSDSAGLESRNPVLLLDATRDLLQIVWEEELPGGGFGLEKRSLAL